MLVACWDQNLGISTSRCSKTTSPFSLPITAARSSHSTSSNGSTPGRVKYRGNSSPAAAAVALSTTSSWRSCWAIVFVSWAALVCILPLLPNFDDTTLRPGRGARVLKLSPGAIGLGGGTYRLVISQDAGITPHGPSSRNEHELCASLLSAVKRQL